MRATHYIVSRHRRGWAVHASAGLFGEFSTASDARCSAEFLVRLDQREGRSACVVDLTAEGARLNLPIRPPH